MLRGASSSRITSVRFLSFQLSSILISPAAFVLINVYCPRADMDSPHRLTYKRRFNRVLRMRAEALVAAGR